MSECRARRPLTRDEQELVEANQGLAYGFCRRCRVRIGRVFDQDDATQEALIAVMLAAKGYSAEGGAGFSTYATRAIINRGRTEMARQRRFRSFVQWPADDGELLACPAPRPAADWIDLEALRFHLALLPDRERAMLHARLWRELQWSAIAEEIGVARQHAIKLYGRALDRLRAALEGKSAGKPTQRHGNSRVRHKHPSANTRHGRA
jgi:RNA polymerase sigma factor (sigma-70 family)